jgi:hypothetical protein
VNFKIKGAINQVLETRQVNDRFTKREFVLDVPDGKYPQLIMFEVTGDKVSQLDGLSPGEAVEVEFSIRGREWRSPSGETKYFNSLNAWKVVPQVADKPAAPSSRAVTSAPADYAGNVGGSDEGDIPFASCDVAFDPSPIARLLR